MGDMGDILRGMRREAKILTIVWIVCLLLVTASLIYLNTVDPLPEREPDREGDLVRVLAG